MTMTIAPQQQAYAPQANGQAWQPARQPQGISLLVYAEPDSGKSCLGDSGPRPSLIADVEGQANWTPSRKIRWDPRHPPPQPPGMRLTAGYGQPSQTPEWETALAVCRDVPALRRVYDVLATGLHPWNSASLDSVTEAQQRIIDTLRGESQMEQRDWGALLRQASGIIRRWRDLTTHPVHPLWTVSFVAGITYDRTKNRYRPLLQGSGQDYIPYYASLFGYLHKAPDGSRVLWTDCLPGYETGEKVGGTLPYAMPIAYPGRAGGWTLEAMVRTVLAS